MAAIFLASARNVEALSDGITGKADSGCGDGCHGDAVAVVTFTPTHTATGLDLQITVADNSVPESSTGGPQGGFDLSASAGILSGDSSVTIAGREATHNGSQGNLQRTWTVHWEPQSPSLCTVDFHVAAMAANGNFTDDEGDHWNLASFSRSLVAGTDTSPPSDPRFLSPRAGDFALNDLSIGLPGQSISGGPTVIAGNAVPLELAVHDDTGIASVEFSAERSIGEPISLGLGTYKATDPEDGVIFQLLWNTTAYLPGSYKLKAKATDCGGQFVTKELEVIVLSGGLK